MKKKLFLLFLTGVFFININFLFCSLEATDSVSRLKSFEYHQKLKNESIFKNLKWRTVGPSFQGGRISTIDVPPGNTFTIYVGVGAGNIWKTTNLGTTWKPIFENESTFTIGDIVIAPSDPDVIYVGTGENLMARSSFAGTGVFKSIDGGKTWKNVGMHDSHHIGRVVVDPKNPDIVYVAVLGHQYTFNEERGLFKTDDGGKTWKKSLYISDKVGVTDVVMDPSDSQILYAAAWERDRKAWNNVESGEGSGIYKTRDAGLSWQKLTNGFPEGKHVGRIGLAVSASNPDVIYALLDNQAPRPERKQEGKKEIISGLTILKLQKMSKEVFLKIEAEMLNQFLRENGVPREYTGKIVLEMVAKGELTPEILAKYLLDLWADRKLHVTDVIGGEVYRSDDEGETWKKINESHLDSFFSTYGYSFCDIRVSPDDENKIYILGIRIMTSDDGGKTFKHIGGKGVHVDHHELWIDPVNPDRIILGNDGGLNFSYDRGKTWQDIKNMPIGEFYTISVDRDTPYKIYGGLQDNGSVFGPSTHNVEYGVEDLWKHIGGGDGFFVEVDPTDLNTVYFEYQFGSIMRKNLKDATSKSIMPKPKIGEPALRFNWMTPFLVSHHNPYILYCGANRIFRSLNRGDNWMCISPDLTTDSGPEKQGDVPYGTITTISESPFRPGLIYAGTDDGNVQVTKNDGVNWSNVSQGLPDKWVSRVLASRYEEGKVFVSLTGYREDDFEKYLYMSKDYGESWTSISSNLPSESINVIREDPANKNILYVGTDLGVYVSLDDGDKWYSLCNDLPTCAVHDLVVHPRENELVIGTHGRSVFILDVGCLQKFNENIAKKTAHLFDIKPARLPRSRGDMGEWSQEKVKEAFIYYYLNESREVKISVFDKSGKLIKNLKGTSDAGMNSAVWDLTFEGGKKIGEEFATAGNLVEQGEYTVEILSGDIKLEGKIKIQGAY